MKILKKNVVSFKEFFVSENKECFCKKKMFIYEGFVCCYMIFIFIVIICEFIDF